MRHPRRHVTRACLCAVVLALGLHAPAMSEMVEVEACDVGLIQNPELQTDVRFLVRYDLPAIVSGSRVELAVLETSAAVRRPGGVGALALDAFALSAPWDGESVEWNGGWAVPGGDLDRAYHAVWSVEPGEAETVRFDLTHIAGAWASGELENHGLIVMIAPGESGRFRPRCVLHGGDPLPKLRVWFRPQTSG